MFSWRNKKILCGYPLLSIATYYTMRSDEIVKATQSLQFNTYLDNGAMPFLLLFILNMTDYWC